MSVADDANPGYYLSEFVADQFLAHNLGRLVEKSKSFDFRWRRVISVFAFLSPLINQSEKIEIYFD